MKKERQKKIDDSRRRGEDVEYEYEWNNFVIVQTITFDVEAENQAKQKSQYNNLLSNLGRKDTVSKDWQSGPQKYQAKSNSKQYGEGNRGGRNNNQFPRNQEEFNKPGRRRGDFDGSSGHYRTSNNNNNSSNQSRQDPNKNDSAAHKNKKNHSRPQYQNNNKHNNNRSNNEDLGLGGPNNVQNPESKGLKKNNSGDRDGPEQVLYKCNLCFKMIPSNEYSEHFRKELKEMNEKKKNQDQKAKKDPVLKPKSSQAEDNGEEKNINSKLINYIGKKKKTGSDEMRSRKVQKPGFLN